MKKNIAIVITRLDFGGAQKIALYLAEKIDKKKFNVFLIAGEGGYLDKEAKKIKNARVIFFKNLKHPISPYHDILTLFELKKFFIQNKIDIVHTHSSKAGILGRIAAKLANIKLIIHTIHGFPFHKYQNFVAFYIYLFLEKLVAKFTDFLIAVGEDIIKTGIKYKIGNKEKYILIRAGIDLNLFKNAKVNKEKYLKKLELCPKNFTVGMIGNLKKQKNPIEFIKIAREVLKIDNKINFIFAGDGPLKKKVNNLLEKYNIKEKVKFIGWTEEPEKLLKAIDLFILTSLWEGVPCTLIQAIAALKPCVVTNIDGNREIISKIDERFLYEPGQIKIAAQKIIEVKNKKLRFDFKKVNFLKEFDLKYMLKEHNKIYDKVN